MFSTLLPSLKLPVTLLGTGRQDRSGRRGYRISGAYPPLEDYRGFAVCDYSFTLDALDLPDSGIYEQHPHLLQH